jgi:hypothetical protein
MSNQYDERDDHDEHEFDTIDNIANNQNLINCYQIQVDDNNNCVPVYLGKYPEVPLPVHRIIKFKKYRLHLVTYVLTEEEIQNKLFKMVGVNVFRQNRKNSLCSLDFVMGPDMIDYQLLFNDHSTNETKLVEKLEKFPGKDGILEYVTTKAFEDPVKSKLLNG